MLKALRMAIVDGLVFIAILLVATFLLIVALGYEEYLTYPVLLFSFGTAIIGVIAGAFFGHVYAATQGYVD